MSSWCKDGGKAAGINLKRQAELLGLPESTFGNAINPHLKAMEYKLSWLIPHMLILNSLEPMNYLASCVGMVMFKLPDAPGGISELHKELALSIKEFGDVVMETGEALKDNRLQRHEVIKIEKEIDEVVRQLMGFRQKLKDNMERL